MKQEIKPNKPILIAGVIILVISLCMIFPFEYSKASLVSDLKFTYFTLGIAMLALMYAFMGRSTYKGLLFLLGSCIFSIICWFAFYPNTDLSEKSSKVFELTIAILSFFENFAILYMGTVTGIVAGLIFIIVNARFLKDENRCRLFFKRLISYLIILGIVSILFFKGGDWIFEISEHFKNSG
ncbi:MAG: hypothetical protein REI64_14500 [Pedobacter sp.]|uniref:hypothetical protein n=1 Tax=Pedobacter sp. TaxID=1411316 RepID=UPI0028078DBC|nr:hypothetical protein [Pedobacter sp.]MDQ8006009.1 hypothetical protein [Pedobacter sp.]